MARRICVVISTLVSLTFVATFRDTGRRDVVHAVARAASVPASVVLRPGRVKVLVEDESGSPIADASVRLLWIQDNQAYLAGAATTGRDGRAMLDRLPLGEAWILAEAEGRARASTRLVVTADSLRDVSLRLARAEQAHIIVVDDGGGPIALASVELRAGDWLPFEATTDERGECELGRLGPGPWKITAKAPGFETGTHTTEQATREPIRIVLRRLGWIDVTMVDPQGRAVDGATLLVAGSGLWPARKTKGDEQGHARVGDLPRGVYDLRATRGDLVSPVEMGVLLERGQTKSLTLALVPGRRVAVRVTAGDGKDAPGIAGASLVLAEGGVSSFPLEAVTDAHGAASLGPIAPGDAFLSARADGCVPKAGVAVANAPNSSVQIGLVPGGTLVGDVVDARGFPIGGATIEVVGTTPSGEPIDESPDRLAVRAAHFSFALTGPRNLLPVGDLGVMPGSLPRVPHAGGIASGFPRDRGGASSTEPWVTNGDGTFRLFPIPPGRVRAIVRHPAYLEGVSELCTVAPSGEAKVHVVLGGGGALEGRLLDERRTPVPSARVDLASTKSSLERTTMTASDGTFAFAAVPGEITLSVYRPEDQDDIALRTTLTVEEGQRRQLEIVLPASREAMTVTVVDERGGPLDGAQVRVASLSPDAPLRKTAFTNRSGRAEFEQVVGLPIRLSVSRQGSAPDMREEDAAPAEMRVALKTGVAVVGTVTARGGREPLSGVEATLSCATGPLRTRTDRAGAFRFEDVPPGPAQLVVERDGYARAERAVRIEAPSRSDRPAVLASVDMQEGASVEGEVVNGRGEPVAGARVAEGAVPAFVPSGRLPPGVVLTDARGEFRIDGLASGDVTLEAYAPEVGRGRLAAVKVASGRATERVRIQLNESDVARRDPGSSGGVAVRLEDGSQGVVIAGVTRGSEADRAGLLAGDRIEAIDGHGVLDVKDAESRLFGPVHEDLIIEIGRNGERQKFRVSRERVYQ